ncbi:MAG: hypothetical protein H7338_07440 [Candidatus Sericytochromatia bacterium]|nr:hypothetical protein [Candidatus Sericytochromatia bacterium]
MSERYCIVLNPKARNGNRGDLQAIVTQAFAGKDVTITVPESLAAARETIRAAVAAGVSHVVLAGGDGTVNGALDLVADTHVRLGLIPCGTANDLAQQLGIPTDPLAACQVILRGERRHLDLIAVNDRFYVTGGALGTATGIAAGVNRWKARPGWRKSFVRMLGSYAYLAYSGLYLMTTRRLWLKVRIDGGKGPQGEAKTLVLLVNNQDIIGKTFKAAPYARSDDGHLDVCLIEWQSRWRGIYLVGLLAMGGRHVEKHGVRIWRDQALTISADEPIAFMGDGEPFAEAKSLAIRVQPQALQMMVPPDLRRTRHLTAPLHWQ